MKLTFRLQAGFLPNSFTVFSGISNLEPVQYLFRIRSIKACTTKCILVLSFRSQFFQSLLHFSIQLKERSTTQRLGITTNWWNSLRLVISTDAPNRFLTS